MLTGENGILIKAKESQEETTKGEEKDQIIVAWNGAKIQKLGKEVTPKELEQELHDNGITEAIVTEEFYITMPSGNKYIINNGIVKEVNNNYSIETINTLGYIEQDVNNPNTIAEGEIITLKFKALSTSEFEEIYVVGAEHEVISWSSFEVVIKVKNATDDVKISFDMNQCCFVKGTQVLMADNTTKNIEDVKIGDFVTSYNEETKEYEKDEVVERIINPNTTDLARLNLADGTNVEMNAYHPVYTQEGWKSLTGHEGLPVLTENDKILSKNSKFIEINTIDRWIEEQAIKTYNLTIKNNHNFFVGNTSILVHNAECPE